MAGVVATWVLAALIAFLVADRLLIRPLHRLSDAVTRHVPGAPFDLSPMAATREFGELAGAFARLNEQIGQHDLRIARALADQTRATREVHHRVKNNLQIIASLISLHARGDHAPEAATAYAAIQRRVDALSIVHRNHYAELGSEHGIDLKALLGELAANLRAGYGDEGASSAISIHAVRFGVSQDVAIALAFLLTELIELSVGLDASATIAIVVENCPSPGKAQLAVTSKALCGTPLMKARLSLRYARVLEGLSRQLRAPLGHDEAAGRFAIHFSVQQSK